MSKKHNTKHLSRGRSAYGAKARQQGSCRMSDPRLSDGKPASVKR